MILCEYKTILEDKKKESLSDSDSFFHHLGNDGRISTLDGNVLAGN